MKSQRDNTPRQADIEQLGALFEHELRGRILQQNLLVFLGATTLCAVALFLMKEGRPIGQIVPALLPFVVVNLTSLVWCRQGKIKRAVHFYTVSVVLMQSVSIMAMGQLHSHIVVSFINLILLNGFIVGPRGALLMCALSSALAIASNALVGQSAWFRIESISPGYEKLVLLASLGSTGFVMASGVRLQSRFMRRATSAARALQKAQVSLKERQRRAVLLSELSAQALSATSTQQLHQPLLSMLEDLSDIQGVAIVGDDGCLLLRSGIIDTDAIEETCSKWNQTPSRTIDDSFEPPAEGPTSRLMLGLSRTKEGTEAVVIQLADEIDMGADTRAFIHSAVGVIRTTAKRIRSEQHLRQAQRIDTIGQLAGGVAHDFNNMLATIVGSNELASSKLEASHPAQSALDMARSASMQASALVNKLLTFSKRRTTEAKVIDFGQTIREQKPLLELFMHEGIELIVDLPEQSVWIVADTVEIQQVLLNLAANARDALPTGGTVQFRLSQKDSESALLQVGDSGRGIADQAKDRLFEPFFSTKHEEGGTGLGLSTVKSIVDAACGDIQVESRKGGGALFSITWPLAHTVPTTAAAPVSGTERRNALKFVMVVDDNKLVRTTVSEMLQTMGLKTVTASNGREALRLIEGGASSGLIITDRAMPDISGMELTRTLRDNGDCRPVIIMSGQAPSPDASLDDLGVYSLHKPITMAALREAIEWAQRRAQDTRDTALGS